MSSPTSLPRLATPFLIYPRLQAILVDIDDCISLTEASGEPNCIALSGDTGMGKTSLAVYYALQHPDKQTRRGTDVPVLYTHIPAPSSIKGTVIRMLAGLGDPAAHLQERTIGSAIDSVLGLIRDCHVRLIILDDFHQLRRARTEEQKVADWLKCLIKDAGVAVFVIGITGYVPTVLESSSELSRLFSVRDQLRPFAYDASSEDVDGPETGEFNKFFDAVTKKVGTKLDVGLERHELLKRIHYATDGVPSYVAKLVLSAEFYREKENKPSVNLEHLQWSFAKRMQEGLRKKLDPFRAGAGKTFKVPKDESE